jgi:SH3-like domain-containing protein
MRSLIARILPLSLVFFGAFCLDGYSESKKASPPKASTKTAPASVEKNTPTRPSENNLTRSPPTPSRSTGMAKGTVTGLPLPRFVSLKSNRVNLRVGPGRDYPTTWVFQKATLPVEITAEFETWRRIRDSEGTEGWVLHSLLSGRRTALVMPWAKKGQMAPFYEDMREDAPVLAQLTPGVLLSIKSCTGTWCSVTLAPDYGRQAGYIKQEHLWGAYPQEEVK